MNVFSHPKVRDGEKGGWEKNSQGTGITFQPPLVKEREGMVVAAGRGNQFLREGSTGG